MALKINLPLEFYISDLGTTGQSLGSTKKTSFLDKTGIENQKNRTFLRCRFSMPLAMSAVT
jgi:hypothetical protein